VTESDKASSDRERRARVFLPRELVEAFRATTKTRGVPGSTLVYGWITQAARLALAGEYDLVPPRSSSPTTSGDQHSIDYPMSTAESTECSMLLRDAGSSTRAVVAACVQAYMEADGNPVRMAWPRRTRSLAA
jgi:hypothetical protein